MFMINTEDEMLTFGSHIAAACEPGMVVFLEGELGAGKTTMVRGVLNAFGYHGVVKSPTYTLVEQYDFSDKTVFHLDLYRLAAAEELEYMGGRDYFSADVLSFVEWPEQGQGYLPQPDLIITILYRGLRQRSVELAAFSERGKKVITMLAKNSGL